MRWELSPRTRMLRHPEDSLERLVLEAVAEHEEELDRQWRITRAWDRWRVESCAERGGHWWWLDLSPDPEDGISFGCRHCPAAITDLEPWMDTDLLTGTFRVTEGYELELDCGDIILQTGKRTITGSHPRTYGWRGPVTASIRTERYGNYFDGYEYDVWIDLDPERN